MWKKDEESTSAAGSTPERPPPPSTRNPQPPTSAKGEPATIGRSITIRGDVTGDEDLYIQGRIEGTVDLKQHSVTVGPEGRVHANIKGRTVTIEGEVEGDVLGQEQVALRSSSKVNGDIVAPRVVLEDGATFLGSIDMSGKAPPKPAQQASPSPPTKPPKIDGSMTTGTASQGSASS